MLKKKKVNFLNIVEKIGNKLPQPINIFIIINSPYTISNESRDTLYGIKYINR